MNFMIINCHTANRGDEAAVHALVDELLVLYPAATITLGMRGQTRYPNMPANVSQIDQLIIDDNPRYRYKYLLAMLSKGRIVVGRRYSEFIAKLKEADVVLHAPGGPNIGDIYYEAEVSYLYIYNLIKRLGKPYMFYAPSMGPFNKVERNEWRKKVLLDAEAVVLRDPISAEHVKKLLPNIDLHQTLDSALQHDINTEENAVKLNEYTELKSFLSNHKRCIGITITDLLWHPVHSKNRRVQESIENSFKGLLGQLVDSGYGVVFVPQLYGAGNDYNLMKSYCTNDKDYFIIPDNDNRYDTYFQQYLIGQLYAVIGMRYHSNIFSAKMGTPFVSVSYEQKMQGFMEKMNLSQYCLPLNDLTPDTLQEKFTLLEKNYSKYKEYLISKHDEMRKESYRTTEILKEVISRLNKGR